MNISKNFERPRIPLMVVLTVVLQCAGVLIWATQLDARVNDLEHQSDATSNIGENLARVEERLADVKQDIEGMKHQLDRLTERLLK